MQQLESPCALILIHWAKFFQTKNPLPNPSSRNGNNAASSAGVCHTDYNSTQASGSLCKNGTRIVHIGWVSMKVWFIGSSRREDWKAEVGPSSGSEVAAYDVGVAKSVRWIRTKCQGYKLILYIYLLPEMHFSVWLIDYGISLILWYRSDIWFSSSWSWSPLILEWSVIFVLLFYHKMINRYHHSEVIDLRVPAQKMSTIWWNTRYLSAQKPLSERRQQQAEN